MHLQPLSQKGRKARIGKVYFLNDRLTFFAGYGECDNCNSRSRILLSPDDAREFSRAIGGSREPLGARMARRMMRRYGL